MYVSTYLTLQTALSGVEAAQEELATTGNNIANANTPDYEDEQVTLNPSLPLTITAGNDSHGMQLGTGVNASGVVNLGNVYMDNAFRQQNQAASNASTTQNYMQQIQQALGEPSATGINAQLAQFWQDWNNLADNPTSTSAKQAVVDDGQDIADSVNTLSGELTYIDGQAQQQYADLTANQSGGQVYDDVQQIQSLNVAIQQATEGGLPDNQLVDQRSAAIDDLSSLASVTVTNNTDGTVNIGFGGIANLVQGTTINWPAGPGFTFPGAASTVGGTLGALLSMTQAGGQIDQALTQLDGVATSLANEVNTTVAGSTSGVTDFFQITTGGAPGSAAASLTVDPALVANPALVPTTDTTDAGDNDLAMAVSQLSGGSADQAYQAFVQQVGGWAQSANNSATTQSSLLTQVTNQRESAEGVDLSQEMTNLIEQQQAYQASAKVMNAFSTVMDSLMSTVGQ